MGKGFFMLPLTLVLLLACSPAFALLQWLGNVRVGGSPQGLVVFNDVIYVALSGDDSVARVTSYLLRPNITRFEVAGASPRDLIIPILLQEEKGKEGAEKGKEGAEKGKEELMIVSCYDQGILVAMDLTSGMQLEKWSVGEGPTFFTQNPIGNLHYIPSELSNILTAFDISTLSLDRSYRTGPTPASSSIGKRGRTAFVPNRGEDSISFLDLVSGLDSRVKLPSGANPRGTALSEDNEILLVTGSGLNQIYFINTTTQQIVHTLEDNIGPTPFAVTLSPSGKYAYVTNAGSNTVSVIDIALRQVADEVVAGSQPISIRIFDDRVFVSNEVGGSVSVFQVLE